MFEAIKEGGKHSLRKIAEATGIAKSSVHRHKQGLERRNKYPFYFVSAGNIQQFPQGKRLLSKAMLEQHTQEVIALILAGVRQF